MKGKKGICLILCLLLLTGLAPLRAAAVCGEQVDGVWASIALTGGANKVLFSADGEIENQILVDKAAAESGGQMQPDSAQLTVPPPEKPPYTVPILCAATGAFALGFLYEIIRFRRLRQKKR